MKIRVLAVLLAAHAYFPVQPAHATNAVALAEHPCFKVSHNGPSACLTHVFGPTGTFEAALLRGKMPSAKANLTMSDVVKLTWIPARFKRGVDRTDTAPTSEMFALFSKTRCAVIDVENETDGDPGVTTGSAIGIPARAVSTAHENGHCARGFLDSRGAVVTGIGNESFADLFLLWAVADASGPGESDKAAAVLLRSRQSMHATIEEYKQIPAEISAVLARTARFKTGESFSAFLARAGLCSGGPCGGSVAAAAAGMAGEKGKPTVRVGWYATTGLGR